MEAMLQLDALPIWLATCLVAAGALETWRRVAYPEPVPERWVAVSDGEWAGHLDRALGQRGAARVVGTLDLPEGEAGANHLDALASLQRLRADRVVLPRQLTTRRLLDVVAACKSLGVPVSVILASDELIRTHAKASIRVGEVAALNIGKAAFSKYVGAPLGIGGGGLPSSNGSPRVSVVIPARNEAENLPYVFSRMPAGIHEVVLVDGRSTDNTREVARACYPGVRVVEQNGHGKGDALRAGFAAATGDIIVTLDADGSADPAEIPRFVDSLARHDFAKGSRFLASGGSDDITWLRRSGNWALCAAVNRLYGTSYSDLCYGYNAFWARSLPYISVDSPGFEVETLVNIRAAKAGLSVGEVPSFEAKRLHGKSNLRTFRDGARVLRTVCLERPDAKRLIHRDRRRAEFTTPVLLERRRRPRHPARGARSHAQPLVEGLPGDAPA